MYRIGETISDGAGGKIIPSDFNTRKRMISRCVWQRGGVTIDPFSFSQLNGKREVKKEYLMWSAPSVLEPLLCWLYSNGSSMLMPPSPERGFHHVSSVWWREKARPSSLLPSSIYKPDGVHVLQSARKSSQITKKKTIATICFVSMCIWIAPSIGTLVFSLVEDDSISVSSCSPPRPNRRTRGRAA